MILFLIKTVNFFLFIIVTAVLSISERFKNPAFQSSAIVVYWVDCKTVRIFAYSSTREQSNKRSGMRLLILRKKPTVLQSMYWVRFLSRGLKLSRFTLTCAPMQNTFTFAWMLTNPLTSTLDDNIEVNWYLPTVYHLKTTGKRKCLHR